MRRKSLILIVALAAILMGGTALATWLWLATGSTTSTETTGTTTTVTVTVTATSKTDALMPGGSAGMVTVTVTNNSGHPADVSGVTVQVTGTSNEGCGPTNFTVTQGTFYNTGTAVSFPYALASGSSIAATASNAPTVALNADAATACQGVTVDLSETAS